MKIFVINLERASERRRVMGARLAALNLPFEFFRATDGQLLTSGERAAVDDVARKRISRFPLTDNEIGCWHSHRRALEMIVNDGLEVAAILEDDAEPTSDLPRVLDAIEESLMPFDLVDLHRKLRNSEIFFPCLTLCDGYDLGRIRYTQMGAIGYVITRDGAARYLESDHRASHAFDKSIKRWWMNGMNYFALSRPVVTHSAERHSLIDETRLARAHYADADGMRSRLIRNATKWGDSIRKRMRFPAYLRAGQRGARAIVAELSDERAGSDGR